MKLIAITGAALLVASAGYAQDETARRQATEIAARVPLEKAIEGAPYSADTVIEGTQVLADGNRIVRKTTGRVYRDGEGRTRREEDQPLSFMNASGVPAAVRTMISIVDPVAGVSYALDPERKIAWSTPIGAGGAIMGNVDALKRKVETATAAIRMRSGGMEANPNAPPGAGAVAGPAARGRVGGPGFATTSGAPLEHRTMEGLTVEGRRTTTVIPAGQIGNEQPLTIASEEWRSPELNVLVFTKHSDPRSGESIYRLTNIVRAEPDRSLFMVPADYTVKETGIRRMLEATRK